MEKFNLIATCAAGIEAITANELKHLGYDVQTENGRVRFSGTMKDVFETNLWLRTADRIKIVVAEFEARTFDELLKKPRHCRGMSFFRLTQSFRFQENLKNQNCTTFRAYSLSSKRRLLIKCVPFISDGRSFLKRGRFIRSNAQSTRIRSCLRSIRPEAACSSADIGPKKAGRRLRKIWLQRWF